MTVADYDLELIQQAALRATGDMRSEYHVLQRGEAVGRRPRLHCVRIEARAGDRACFQRLVQRVLVDQPATIDYDVGASLLANLAGEYIKRAKAYFEDYKARSAKRSPRGRA